MSFKDFGLSSELCDVVESLGYHVPTQIQQRAIPSILQGRDIVACAETGTGKTASFILPLLDILQQGHSKVRMPRAVILEPTRELALQVFESFQKYGTNHQLSAALLVGGESFSDQEKALKKGVDVLIATPGRLFDLFERGSFMLLDAKLLVIDEADRMLDMGFIPDVERLMQLLPPKRQTLMFTATLPEPVLQITKKYMDSPKEILVSSELKTAKTVEQCKVMVDQEEKREVLLTLLKDCFKNQKEKEGSVLIFCNRKSEVSQLASSLKRSGFKASALHGDMEQSQRRKTLLDFKNGQFNVLVASDIASRGLDMDSLSLVVNFGVPLHPEEYVHRIGRTGRAGQFGMAVTLVSQGEKKALKFLETSIREELTELKVNPPANTERRTAEKPLSDRRSPDLKTSEGTERRKEHRSRNGRDRIESEISQGPVLGFGDFIPAFMLTALTPLDNSSAA